MLGFIEGKVIAKNQEHLQCIVFTNGMGYELTLPRKTFDSIALGQTVSVWIQTVVREDAFLLYGFLTEVEKHFFKLLLSVGGLGPKTALSLLGEHGPLRLLQLVLAKNTSEISTAPGVGKKLAERLVLELKGKVEKWSWLEYLNQSERSEKQESFVEERHLREDLTSALVHLGYQTAQIKNTLDRLFENEPLEKQGFESSLRLILKEMSSRIPRDLNG